MAFGRHQEIVEREIMQDLVPGRNSPSADCVDVSAGKDRWTNSSFHLARFHAFLFFIWSFLNWKTMEIRGGKNLLLWLSFFKSQKLCHSQPFRQKSTDFQSQNDKKESSHFYHGMTHNSLVKFHLWFLFFVGKHKRQHLRIASIP